jgi:hypothetical protein
VKHLLDVEFRFEGLDSSENQIDFYDVSQALIGFQRSLAITTHLVLNNQIIVQAPSLKNARILATPPQPGSWEIVAMVVGSVGAFTFAAGQIPKNSALGHLIHSAYDYIISSLLGFHVDYDKSLGQQYEELKSRNAQGELKPLTQQRLESAAEKCEAAVKEMHRPIWKSRTADSAVLISRIDIHSNQVGERLDIETYDFIDAEKESDDIHDYVGSVSSYNLNTFKGRIFVEKEERPIAFLLLGNARDAWSTGKIAYSLAENVRRSLSAESKISFRAFEVRTRSGRLKRLNIFEIE